MSYKKTLRDICLLAKKDFYSCLNSPVLYSIASVYLFLSGFFFFSYLKVFNPLQRISAFSENEPLSINSAVIIPLFDAQVIFLLLLIPLVAAKSFSDERRNGTLELLLTMPVSATSIVLGKWLGVIYQIVLIILLGAVFPFSLCLLSDPEILPVVFGLFGLFIVATALSSIAIFFSAISKSFVTASSVSLFISMLWFMLDIPFENLDISYSNVIEDFSLSKHSNLLTKGLFSTISIYVLVFFSYFALRLSIMKFSNSNRGQEE